MSDIVVPAELSYRVTAKVTALVDSYYELGLTLPWPLRNEVFVVAAANPLGWCFEMYLFLSFQLLDSFIKLINIVLLSVHGNELCLLIWEALHQLQCQVALSTANVYNSSAIFSFDSVNNEFRQKLYLVVFFTVALLQLFKGLLEPHSWNHLNHLKRAA